MAYGLKVQNAQGKVVFDGDYRYNNTVMTGITTIPGTAAGEVSPFIALSGANDPNRFLIFSASMFGDGFYTPVFGAAGFRWRRTAAGTGPLNIDYTVVRIG